MARYTTTSKHVKNLNPENQEYRKLNARKVNSAKFPDGHLYLLKMKGFDIYKVGVSKKPKRRILDLKAANPFELEVLFCSKFKDVYSLEELVLDVFKMNIIKGEWFNSFESDINDLLSCLNNILNVENGV